MRMLLNFYRVLGVAACLTFGVGSARGWKVPGPGLVVSGGSQSAGSSSGSHGFFHFGSGRSSSGSGGWGGGK